MMLCPKCGNDQLKLVAEHLHEQVFRCGKCGEATSSRFYPAELVFDPDGFEVRLVWQGTVPTSKDALAVRSLDIQAAKTGVQELLADIQSRRAWSLGVHSDYQAHELGKRAEALGLKVELIKVPWADAGEIGRSEGKKKAKDDAASGEKRNN